MEFLKNIKSDDLENLVDCLTHEKNGKKRFTETLTQSEAYKTYYPDHNQYWELIAAEIQRYGANSFATLLRGGKGVKYKEILMDVCDKLKVNYHSDSSVTKIENNLLMKVLIDEIENMSPEELKELARSTGARKFINLTPEVMLALFQAVFHAGGFKSYHLSLMIVNAFMNTLLGRSLSLSGNLALTRTLAVLTGPIGWSMTGLLTTIDIAGPAYRVTIPAVIQVAVLRQKYLYEKPKADTKKKKGN